MNVKWGRHLGRRGQYTPQPVIAPRLDSSLLYRAPTRGLGVVGEGIAGYSGGLSVEPGGAILPNAVLAQFPLLNYHPIATAALAVFQDVFFAPGHFYVRIEQTGCQYTTTTQRRAAIRIVKRGETSWSTVGPDGRAAPESVIIGIGTQLATYTQFQVYCPGEWQMLLACLDALALNNYFTINVQVQPVHLLDEFASQF